MNEHGVFLHVLGDALGSIGVIGSALVMKYAPGEYRFLCDPIVSLVICVIIVQSAIPLTKRCVSVLLHSVPVSVRDGGVGFSYFNSTRCCRGANSFILETVTKRVEPRVCCVRTCTRVCGCPAFDARVCRLTSQRCELPSSPFRTSVASTSCTCGSSAVTTRRRLVLCT